MTSEERVPGIPEIIARSSLGQTGVSDLCARTSSGTVASILRRASAEQLFDDLDEEFDLDEGLGLPLAIADRIASLWDQRAPDENASSRR
jgi:hypothetical protein